MQVAGVPVGKIQSIDLTPDGQADVRMKITDAGYRPLRRGTKAVIRQASLSGVANRYIDLQLPAADHQETIPAGGVIDQSDTTTAVDLDQLFNTFDPKTRKALSGLIRGSAASYAGEGEQANAGWAYLNPSLAASSRLFKALDADTPALKRFIGQSSQLVGDLATRRADLAGLVDHLATTTGAIGRQKQALSTAIGDLPGFMRRADTTFVNLRATLDDLQPLVDESKPVAKKLRPFLAELRPLARDARPTLRDLSALVRSPGASNDLIELTKSSVPVRNAAVGPTKRNGKQRDGAFPGSTKALAAGHPRAGHGAALRARPHRLVRRLQPLRPLRRARRGQPRGAVREPLRARQRRAQAAARPAARRATPSRTPPRWTSAGAARGRSSAARPGSPAPTSPATPRKGRSDHEARARSRLLVVAGLGVGWIVLTGAGENPDKGKYWVQFDNAFGLIQGGDLKVAGVRAGKITDIKLDKRTKHALVGFKIDKNGFGSLRSDAFCESRPQSLIGEYFVDCQPGTAKQELKPGAVIPVTRTASTVAPDLVNDILRRPYRERLSLIIGSLGAGVAGNAENLNAAIRRASPALRETDKVLATLGAQNKILGDLTVNADKVVGDLAANRKDVGRFVTEAKDTAQASAERRGDIAAGLRELPGFLEQLQPTMKALGQVADDQGSALHNLDSSSKQLTTFFDQLGPVRRRLAARLQVAGQRVEEPAIAPSRRRRRSSPSSAPSPPARRSSARTSRSCCSTSTTASTPSRRTRAAPAARATPASRRCCSTPTTRRPRRRSSTRTTTSSRSAPSSGRAPTTPARTRSRRTRTSSANAARASGPIQPGLNYPDVTKRAAQDAKDRGAAKRASGDHDLPLPAVPAPVDTPAPVGARRPPPRPRPRRCPASRPPRRRRCRRPPSLACRPSTCRRCPASAVPAATIAVAPRRSCRCPSSARRPAATRRPRPSSSTTC